MLSSQVKKILCPIYSTAALTYTYTGSFCYNSRLPVNGYWLWCHPWSLSIYNWNFSSCKAPKVLLTVWLQLYQAPSTVNIAPSCTVSGLRNSRQRDYSSSQCLGKVCNCSMLKENIRARLYTVCSGQRIPDSVQEFIGSVNMFQQSTTTLHTLRPCNHAREQVRIILKQKNKWTRLIVALYVPRAKHNEKLK